LSLTDNFVFCFLTVPITFLLLQLFGL